MVSDEIQTLILWLKDSRVTLRHPHLRLASLETERLLSATDWSRQSAPVNIQTTSFDFDIAQLAMDGFICAAPRPYERSVEIWLTPAGLTILKMLEALDG